MKVYKTRKWLSSVFLFGALFFIWMSYISLYLPIFSIIFGLMALLCVFSITNARTITVTDKFFKIKSRIGKTKKVEINDIESYLEIDRPLSIHTKETDSKELIIFTKNTKFSIYSIVYEDYDSLKEALTKRKKTNVNFEKEISKKEGNLILILLAILGVGFTLIYLIAQKNIECLFVGLAILTYVTHFIVSKNRKAGKHENEM